MTKLWTSEIWWLSSSLLTMITQDNANMNVMLSTSNLLDFTEELYDVYLQLYATINVIGP